MTHACGLPSPQVIRSVEQEGREAAKHNVRGAECPYRDEGEGHGWLLRQAWHRGYREDIEAGIREHRARAMW